MSHFDLATYIEASLAKYKKMHEAGDMSAAQFQAKKDVLFALPEDWVPKTAPTNNTLDQSSLEANRSGIGSKAEALRLIDADQMVSSTFTLTPTDLAFCGRKEAMSSIDGHLSRIFDDHEQSETIDGKGQPIIATGATTGMGKSRLLHEVRREYQDKGYRVVIVSYTTGGRLIAHKDEKSVLGSHAIDAFHSRLLSMMLPHQEFDKCRSTLHKRFVVSSDDVSDVMAEKFAGSNVLILMDEVGELRIDGDHPEAAINEVISALGYLAGELSQKLHEKSGNFCAAIFTALSEGVLAKAQTNSGRVILQVSLPLLSEADVGSIVKKRYPNADEAVVGHIFAMSAGHSRTVAKFLGLKWETTRPKPFETNKALIDAVCQSAIGPLKEKEVRAILLGTQSDEIDFQELSRRSLVYATGDSACTVPAFLYKWASSTPSVFARHVKSCLEAAWRRIFLSGEKEGSDGKGLEKFLWHYEAVRRDLLQGHPVSVTRFYNFDGKPKMWSEKRKFLFPIITETEDIDNPPGNVYSNFNASGVCVEENIRYQPSSDNFPKYDWFAVMLAEDGTKVVKGEQSKHGSGVAQETDAMVVSVKLSTHETGLTPWRKRGWLVLGKHELERYLGPTFASASVCLRYHSSKRPRQEGKTDSEEVSIS